MGLTGAIARTAATPLRAGLSAGELALELALGVVRGTRRALRGDDDRDRYGAAAAPFVPRPGPPPPRPLSEAAPVRPVAAEPPLAGAKEVDDAATRVAEVGGAGAEEDAGAEVRVEAPWDGYDDMTAAQIQQRLSGAGREVAAAVSLYEGSRRARRSVVRAADRRVRVLSTR